MKANVAARLCVGLACLALATMRPAAAADDEIMVTDGDLAKVGKPELEVHLNVAQGSRLSPGEEVFAPNHILRATPELSIGLSDHWDAGLYLPTSWVPAKGLYFDGIKLRAKTIHTYPLDDDAHLFYGVQFEAADLNPGATPDRTSLEVKLIGGVEIGNWSAAINAVEQRDIPDSDLFSPAHAVNAKLVRNLGHEMALGVEHYISWSSTAVEEPLREIDNLTFLTVQWKARNWDLHLGIGHGWSHSPDQTVVKLVVGIPID